MARWRTKGARSRYGVKAVIVRGIRYHSQKEADYHGDLLLLEKAGHIKNLSHQIPYRFIINERYLVKRSKRYPNGRKVKYIADFRYRNTADGGWHVIDVKGEDMDTEESRLKRALMEAVHGIRVEIV